MRPDPGGHPSQTPMPDPTQRSAGAPQTQRTDKNRQTKKQNREGELKHQQNNLSANFSKTKITNLPNQVPCRSDTAAPPPTQARLPQESKSLHPTINLWDDGMKKNEARRWVELETALLLAPSGAPLCALPQEWGVVLFWIRRIW